MVVKSHKTLLMCTLIICYRKVYCRTTTIIDVTRRYYWIFDDNSRAQITAIVHVICFANQRKPIIRNHCRRNLTYNASLTYNMTAINCKFV